MNEVKQNGHDIQQKIHAATKASEWRKARHEGHPIDLPSGKCAILKPVALDQLLANGEIPDFLTSVAAKTLWDEESSANAANSAELSNKLIALVDHIVPLAMLSPKVVPIPQDGEEEIAIEDIDFGDKMIIFNLAIQGSSVLKNFRQSQEKLLASVRDSENHQQPTESDSGDRGSVGSVSTG